MKFKIEQDTKSKYLRINGNQKTDILTEMGKAKVVKVKVKDPLFRDVEAEYLILNDNKTGIIKLGNASGLTLLKEEEKNPICTSSYGTGEMIMHALNQGCRNFIIGLADSSTVDCGVGLLAALGVKFYDKNNHPVELNGKGIKNINRFDTSSMDPRLKDSKFTLVTNLENKYCGMSGSAYIDGPDIGATKLMIEALERGLINFAYVVRNQLGIDIEKICGAGVAGGIAGSIIVFLNGEIKKSVEIDI